MLYANISVVKFKRIVEWYANPENKVKALKAQLEFTEILTMGCIAGVGLSLYKQNALAAAGFGVLFYASNKLSSKILDELCEAEKDLK